MIAPLPTGESDELPYTLKAVTFANTLDPQGKLKGGAIAVEMLTEHERAKMIPELAPLQFTRS